MPFPFLQRVNETRSQTMSLLKWGSWKERGYTWKAQSLCRSISIIRKSCHSHYTVLARVWPSLSFPLSCCPLPRPHTHSQSNLYILGPQTHFSMHLRDYFTHISNSLFKRTWLVSLPSQFKWRSLVFQSVLCILNSFPDSFHVRYIPFTYHRIDQSISGIPWK